MDLVEEGGVEEGGCSQWRQCFFVFSKFCRADLGVIVNVFMRNTLIQAATQTRCKPFLRKNKTSKQKKKKTI